MLVISNSLQSLAWAAAATIRTESPDESEDLVQLLPKLKGFWSDVLLRTTLFFVAFLQLNYLIDIVARLLTGRRERMLTPGRLSREILTKCLESAPQLYFQGYVLLALGTHGEPLQAASVAISVLSLTHGGTKIFLMFDPGDFVAGDVHKRLSSIPSRIMMLLAGSFDQAWRAGAVALVLTQASRTVGVAVLLGFWLVFVLAGAAHLNKIVDLCGALCVVATLGTLVAHLTPGMLMIMGDATHVPGNQLIVVMAKCVPRSAVLRWMEGLACVSVAFAVSKTPCGYTPWREAWGLLGSLLSSAFLYLALQLGSRKALSNCSDIFAIQIFECLDSAIR